MEELSMLITVNQESKEEEIPEDKTEVEIEEVIDSLSRSSLNQRMILSKGKLLIFNKYIKSY